MGELDIGVRNCSSWVAYRSTPILIQHKVLKRLTAGWFQRQRATWATAWGKGCLVRRGSPAQMAIHPAIVSPNSAVNVVSFVPYLSSSSIEFNPKKEEHSYDEQASP